MSKLRIVISISLILVVTIVTSFSIEYVLWSDNQIERFDKSSLMCEKPIRNIRHAIDFGKLYASREPGFVKLSGFLSQDEMAKALDLDHSCCKASIEADFQGYPTVWLIEINHQTSKQTASIVIRTTSCRRVFDAHW